MIDEDKKVKIQEELEKKAVLRNKGICTSYDYCDYCAEPEKIYRTSLTPCADAYLKMKSKHKKSVKLRD